jgi:D-alanyl-lipoteichoic acid acyltransferase DltB (MBOAT superfamily)
LSTWFRDYVYIPLGGSRGGTWHKVRNTFVIFVVSGFWHGANWTFIAWGALNAIYFLPLLLTKSNRNYLEIVAKGKYFPTIRELSLMFITFVLTVFAWIFFRAENMGHAFEFISQIVSSSIMEIPRFSGMPKAILTLALVLLFLIIEWLGREHQYAIANLDAKLKRPIRYAVYYSLIIAIFLLGGNEQEFIYFQF